MPKKKICVTYDAKKNSILKTRRLEFIQLFLILENLFIFVQIVPKFRCKEASSKPNFA